MGHVVGIIQVKGGVGRSTIATNLAALLAEQAPTALVDCDLPQGTSASWYALRQAEVPSSRLALATAGDYRELVKTVGDLVRRYAYVIVDAPPRIAEMTRAVVMLSGLNLVPLGASAAEIWSFTDLLKTVEEARRYRPDLDVRIVWNRFRGYTRAAQELSEGVRRELAVREMKSRLGYRVAYTEALGRGLSVAEWLDGVAHAEMAALADEVVEVLEGGGDGKGKG
jgi:chromosome partitioning protein